MGVVRTTASAMAGGYVYRDEYDSLRLERDSLRNRLREAEMAVLRVSAQKDGLGAIIERQQGYIDRLLIRIEELTGVLKSFMAQPARPTVPIEQAGAQFTQPTQPMPTPLPVWRRPLHDAREVTPVTPALGVEAVSRGSVAPDGWE